MHNITTRVLGLVFVAATTAASAPAAFAQILPAPTPLYSPDPAQPLYYKDGNGLNLFQRWTPSDNGCGDLTKQSDTISQYTNPLKCIPLGLGSNSFITLNGTERLRTENVSHTNL